MSLARNIPTWMYDDTRSIDFLGIFELYHQEIEQAHKLILEKLNLNNAHTGFELDVIGGILGLERSFEGELLDDKRYKRLIQGKIAKDSWNGSLEGMNETIKKAFGNDLTFTIEDKLDMSIVVYVVGDVNDIDKALIESNKYSPKPVGVNVSYIFLENPIFTYDVEKNTPYKAGWDVGAWNNIKKEG